jgi:benzoate membrane transport protein
MSSRWVPNTIEHGPGFRDSLSSIVNQFDISQGGAGLTATIFGCTGPAILVLQAAEQGGMSQGQAVSWLFGIYVLGGLLGIGLTLYYKQPICGAASLPGVAMVGIILTDFTLSQAVGAYFVSGVLVLVIGLSGIFRTVVDWLPQPIVMGMVVGILIEFAIDSIVAIQDAAVIGGLSFAGYLLFKRYLEVIPGIVGAIISGTAASLVLGEINFNQVSLELATPVLITPEFSIGAVISIAIPLTILVIAAENMQAIGVLQAADYDPPVNSMLIFSGIGGMLASFVGAHNVNVAGPMTAITAGEDAGPKEGRYVASLINGVLFATFGLVAASAASLVNAVPSSLVALLAGIAMVGVLINSLEDAFHNTTKYRYGAFFSLIISMSGITIYNIDAAFWALIGGIVVSKILEPTDWSPPEDSSSQARPTIDD